MHIGSVLLTIWLVIGGIAAGQRGDYSGPMGCSTAGTIAVTVLACRLTIRACILTSTAPCGIPAISHNDSAGSRILLGCFIKLPGSPVLANLRP